MTEKIDYTLDTTKFSKNLKNPDKNINTNDRAPEKMSGGLEVSTGARDQTIGVFERYGKPLSLPSQKGFPITLDVGGNISSYTPKGEISDTGGVFNNYAYGDKKVADAQGVLSDWQKSNQNAENTFQYNQQLSLLWEGKYNDINAQWSDFYQANVTNFQAGYSLLDSGDATFQSDGKGGWVLSRTEGSKAPQEVIDRFNTAYAYSVMYSNYSNNAWNNYRYYENRKGGDLYWIDYTREKTLGAQNQYSEAERMRYRYLLSGVDFEKKIEASQKGFTGIFGREYTSEAIRENYYKSMDTLGAFMNRMQSGKILTERDFQKEIQEIGKSLSMEEKIIFLSMIGANLNNLTYNWDKVTSGKMTPVKPFESMQALAKAYQTGKQVPAGVCSSIHVAVSTIAEMWGTPAGTVTVGSGGVGHVVSIMNIDGKHVLSDYGKIYTAPTIEELFDNYGKANESVLIRNYITDASGKIVGHIDTPLSKEYRKQALSETNVTKMLETGEMAKDGINISLYNGEKSLRGVYIFDNGIYIGGKYSEAQLMKGIDAKTISLTAGKKWNDISLGNDWKGQAFVEGHLSQSQMQFDGRNGVTKPTIGQIQAGIRGTKNLEGGHELYVGTGLRMIGQGSRPENNQYVNLPIIGTGTTGESGINLGFGGTYNVSPNTRVGLDGKIETNRGVNVQSVSGSDLNPFSGPQYTSRTGSIGVETKVGDGYITGIATKTQGPLSKEQMIGIGYSNGNMGGSIETKRIEGTHVFGPTNQNIIKANIEGTFGTEKSGTWFAGVEKGGIGGTQGKVGVKWKF